jgi:hypothetical protein
VVSGRASVPLSSLIARPIRASPGSTARIFIEKDLSSAEIIQYAFETILEPEDEARNMSSPLNGVDNEFWRLSS